MGHRITSAEAIAAALTYDHRTVLSRWRSLIYLRRASNQFGIDERRWWRIPASEEDLTDTIKKMLASRMIESISNAPNCYLLGRPFGPRPGIRERELLFELNPYAVLVHYSALEFHGLTLDQPKVIHAWSAPTAFIPLGTLDDEWRGIRPPRPHYPTNLGTQRVNWFSGRVDPEVGVSAVADGPTPIRVTDIEMTLIHALQHPQRNGGIRNVLAAWSIGSDFIDVEKIVTYAEHLGGKLVRQRVGFILEELGVRHPHLDVWAAETSRGGSNRLVSSEPFLAPTNRRWNLSINVPTGVLHE